MKNAAYIFTQIYFCFYVPNLSSEKKSEDLQKNIFENFGIVIVGDFLNT